MPSSWRCVPTSGSACRTCAGAAGAAGPRGSVWPRLRAARLRQRFTAAVTATFGAVREIPKVQLRSPCDRTPWPVVRRPVRSNARVRRGAAHPEPTPPFSRAGPFSPLDHLARPRTPPPRCAPGATHDDAAGRGPTRRGRRPACLATWRRGWPSGHLSRPRRRRRAPRRPPPPPRTRAGRVRRVRGRGSRRPGVWVTSPPSPRCTASRGRFLLAHARCPPYFGSPRSCGAPLESEPEPEPDPERRAPSQGAARGTRDVALNRRARRSRN